MQANEPPFGMRKTRLSLQYCVKLMANEVNLVATYAAKEKAIKPLGLRIERHQDEVGCHPHIIVPYKVINSTMETNRTQYLV